MQHFVVGSIRNEFFLNIHKDGALTEMELVTQVKCCLEPKMELRVNM